MNALIRNPLTWLAGTLILGLVLVAGGYNVAASAGHFSGVGFLLHQTMRNSVRLRAPASVPANIEDSARVAQGAGHYHHGCADCHGAPGLDPNVALQRMVPPPPRLSKVIEQWQPAELFWIVKHGIKMTGMPAWPAAARDDEVWAVVAFLQRLPQLSPAAYQRLIRIDETELPSRAKGGTGEKLSHAFETTLRRCANCHGFDGRGRGLAAFPRLDTLSRDYLAASLKAYRSGERASGMMQLQVAGLSDHDLMRLADYYAQPAQERQQPIVAGGRSQAVSRLQRWQRGRQLVLEGSFLRNIPACSRCHSPTGYEAYPIYPVLLGQHQGYLRTQLQLFKTGERGGSAYAPIMHWVAQRLSLEDIDAVAYFYAAGAEAAVTAELPAKKRTADP